MRAPHYGFENRVPLNPLDYHWIIIGSSLDYHDISWYFPIFFIFPHENNHLLGLILPARLGSSAVQVGHVGDSTAILGRLGANDQLIPVQLTRARQGTGEGVLGLAKQEETGAIWSPVI